MASDEGTSSLERHSTRILKGQLEIFRGVGKFMSTLLDIAAPVMLKIAQESHAQTLRNTEIHNDSRTARDDADSLHQNAVQEQQTRHAEDEHRMRIQRLELELRQMSLAMELDDDDDIDTFKGGNGRRKKESRSTR